MFLSYHLGIPEFDSDMLAPKIVLIVIYLKCKLLWVLFWKQAIPPFFLDSLASCCELLCKVGVVLGCWVIRACLPAARLLQNFEPGVFFTEHPIILSHNLSANRQRMIQGMKSGWTTKHYTLTRINCNWYTTFSWFLCKDRFRMLGVSSCFWVFSLGCGELLLTRSHLKYYQN